MVAVAVGWLVGLGLGAFVPEGGWRAVLALVVMAAGAGLALALRSETGQRRLGRWGFVLVTTFALGAGVAAARDRDAAPGAAEVPGGLARVTARVVSSQHAGDRSRSVLRLERGRRVQDRAPLPAGAWVRAYGRALPAGARVRTLLSVRPRTPFRNPTPHPPWPAWRKVAATAHVPPGTPVRVLARSTVDAVREAARTRVRRAIVSTLDDDTAALCRALVLGEGRAVREEARSAVRGAGLAHVLAVSGLHVAIVAGLCAWVTALLWLWLPGAAVRVEARRVAAAVGIPCALGFAAFAGGAPSAWRAAWTACLGFALVLAGRRPAPLAVGAAAAIVLGALEPARVIRPGFLLSIGAAAAIVTAPATGGLLRRALSLTARTMVATAPLCAWCFGAVPLVGLVANAVLVPVASLLLVPGAVVHAAVATLVPAAATLTAPVLSVLAHGFLAACATFAKVPWGRALPPPDVLEGLVLAAAAVALLAARSWRHRLAVVGAVALLLVGAELWLRHREQPTGEVRATYLDVGQGDAALVDLPDGRLMLIDAGGAVRGPDPGERVLAPLLAARRRGRVDVAVITHAHPDHYKGLAAVLAQTRIGELWTTRQGERENPEGEAARLLAAARRRGTRVRYPSSLCGHPRRYGGARVRVLWPCPRYDAGYGLNDNSLVLRLDYGHRALLFAGDLESHAESVLARRLGHPKPVDVLKVPHHGSSTSSTPALLDALHPAAAVVSCGAHNRFGHPAADVIARYRARGVFVARTDRMGGVVVETDGRSLALRSWRGDRWSARGR